MSIMSLSRFVVGLISLTLAMPIVAAPLSEVVSEVLRKYPDLRTSQALLNAADERIVQARSNYYPVLGIEAQATNTSDIQFNQPLERTTRRTEAFVRWNLFRGLTDRKTLQVAEYDRDAAASDLGQAHEQVSLQVTQVYLEVLRLRRLVLLGENYIVDHMRLNEDVRTRADLGRVAIADFEYANSSLIQAQLQQSQLRGQLRGAEEYYRLLVGRMPEALTEPVLDSASATLRLEQLMSAEAVGTNRRVRAAQARAEARSEEVGVAAGGLYPSLDLELRRALQSEIDPKPVSETDHSASLQLRYQLPLGGASYSRKREAVERKLAAQAAVDTELLQIRNDIAKLWTSWQESRIMAPRLAERVAASDKIVSAYDLQFSAGRRSLIDLISVRNDRYRAQADLLNNRIEQQVSAAQMLALLGRLRESLLGAADISQTPAK